MDKADLYRDLPRLQTPRLTLRAATDGDVLDIFGYASDRDVTRYLRWGPHQNLKQTQDYVSGVLTEYRQGEDGPWFIEDRKTQRIIGHIHLMDFEPQHSKAQVGFVLAKEAWNKGIMTEVLGKVLEFCFQFGINRVEALPTAGNRPAIRVLEKVGMEKEGELREYAYQKGEFHDFSIYSMLRKDSRV